jgi:hypothetical protein
MGGESVADAQRPHSASRCVRCELASLFPTPHSFRHPATLSHTLCFQHESVEERVWLACKGRNHSRGEVGGATAGHSSTLVTTLISHLHRKQRS